MPARLQIDLSAEQKAQLQAWTKNPPKPHLRARAWAILLVAGGKAAYQVAQDRRVRVHRITVAEWVARFQQEGIAGLKTRPGQGRKPAFSPSDPGGSAGSA